MIVEELSIPEVLLITPRRFDDDRGYFVETWQEARYAETGIPATFVQDNLSRSVRGTLRGLHYQIEQAQGKLVRVVDGEVFDVAVDIRRSSPTYGQWAGAMLSEENARQLWVPPGFAHAFYVTSAYATFEYKCTDYYALEHERCIRWDDPALGIDWPTDIGGEPLLSDKDAGAPLLADAEHYS